MLNAFNKFARKHKSELKITAGAAIGSAGSMAIGIMTFNPLIFLATGMMFIGMSAGAFLCASQYRKDHSKGPKV